MSINNYSAGSNYQIISLLKNFNEPLLWKLIK